MTVSKFAEILDNPESSTLDYKRTFYDFSDDKDFKNTSKFVKDVVSFANTIRNESAYIIFGVEQTENSFNLIGINESFDDSILQEKIKDKIFPRVNFLYSEIYYEQKKFGIIEIPIFKYELPITPSVKMKGLETGKIYYRNGSSNTEATGIESIRINDWLKNLPTITLNTSNLNDEITNLIKRTTEGQERLSTIITDILSVAKKYNLENLYKFSYSQLKGIDKDDSENHKYRIQKIFISVNKFEINPYSFVNTTSLQFKNEIEKEDGVYEFPFLFNQSITKLESLSDDFSKGDDRYATLTMSSQYLFKKGNYDIYLYLFENNLKNLYGNIRQKIIDELMKI